MGEPCMIVCYQLSTFVFNIVHMKQIIHSFIVNVFIVYLCVWVNRIAEFSGRCSQYLALQHDSFCQLIAELYNRHRVHDDATL